MKATLKAFSYAVSGLKYAIFQERNIKIEICCACMAAGLGITLAISSIEWCIIILCISTVLFMEVINTAIEKLCDRMHTGRDVDIGLVKDVSAAAVLIASLGALICGAFIFIPKIILIIKS